MARLLRKTFMMLTLVVAVATLVLPGVQAHAADSEPVASDVVEGLDAASLVQAVLDSFESLEFEDGAALITANGGREYRFDLDVGELVQGLGQSTGNSTLDLMKFSLILGVVMQSARVLRRMLRMLPRH